MRSYRALAYVTWSGLVWSGVSAAELKRIKLDAKESHLKVINMDIEATAAIFGQWVGEFLVGFAEHAVLGVL